MPSSGRFAMGVAAVISAFAWAASMLAATEVILHGSYRSDAEGGRLEAVFTPNGVERWLVDFHFEFQGEPLTFSGDADGSLDDGPLAGLVHNMTGTRTFTFRGTVRQGRFEGTHAEIENGIEFSTGTLVLQPADEPAAAGGPP